MAAPFTITSLYSGCSNLPSVGYRDTKEYGGKGDCSDPNATGITLGTAMTISGAATSPNMGYHSSPVLSFLLTLFNIRLGLWLGNPSNDKTFILRGPRLAIRPIISDLFGLTNEKNRYIYLSDGGHFENLGLYEMILRRCHYIVLVDAGCDDNFEFKDLGNAIRKIRIDLGVEIELDKTGNYSMNDLLKKGKYCVIFTIKYPDVETKTDEEKAEYGKLVYIKPTLCGNEPADVLNYAKTNTKFPHELTGDQWFSESQFESYRKLGLHTMEQICNDKKTFAGLKDFFDQAANYVNPSEYYPPRIPD